MSRLIIVLCSILLAACATSEVGTLTYDKAVAKYGPPDKESVVSGRRVSVWNVGSTTRKTRFLNEDIFDTRHNQVIRTFDAAGLLVEQSFR